MNKQDKEYILSQISNMLDNRWFKSRIENWEMVAFSIWKFEDDFEQTFEESIEEYNNYLKSYEKN